jgi:Protein of unknown function (DUF3551)
MRIALIAASIVAATSFSVPSAGASEGPWCALISLGPGSVYEDCQYRTFEQCRPNVLAGNRGFCNPNPRYVGNAPKKQSSRQRRQQY